MESVLGRWNIAMGRLRGALEEREESSKPGKTQCLFLIQIVLRAALKWP